MSTTEPVDFQSLLKLEIEARNGEREELQEQIRTQKATFDASFQNVLSKLHETENEVFCLRHKIHGMELGSNELLGKIREIGQANEELNTKCQVQEIELKNRQNLIDHLNGQLESSKNKGDGAVLRVVDQITNESKTPKLKKP